MAVYVDQVVDYGQAVRERLGHSKWCHMTADTREELHAMAEAIGLRRSWFQDHDGVSWHYDITPGRREMAIRQGARAVTSREMGALITARRQG